MKHIHYSTIDSELRLRLKLDIEFRDYKFTGGKKTHNYFINGKRCFCFNIHQSGKLSGSFYLANPVMDNPNFAVEDTGRVKSWGKRINLSKCGETDSDRFDYLVKLISQSA